MKIKYSFLVLSLLFIFGATELIAQNSAKGVARLKGKVLNFGSTVVLNDFSETQNITPSSFNRQVEIYKDSIIELEVPLKAPAYFRIGRNKLYLSPGDNLEFIIDNNRADFAVFKGKGSAINTYMKDVPFPKAGSFLEAGRNLKATPDLMLKFILSAAKERNRQLTSLKGVSQEFVRLEKARNRADIIKSILAVPAYSYSIFKDKPKEDQESYNKEFKRISDPVKDSLLKNFFDPSLLQVEVYRDIDSYLDITKAKPSDLQIFHDWQKANNIARSIIKPLSDKSKIPSIKLVVDSIKTKKYRDILHLLLAEKMKFGEGDTAIDFTVNNTDGTTTNLSSLKGKVIYIDIWATWCGPCMAEMPHLEELKEKYKSQNDLAIISLSVDDNDPIWLKNLEKRKPEGIQWRIDRPKLSAYEVESIPRYILIDKDFKIANFTAPKASDIELTKILNNLLGH